MAFHIQILPRYKVLVHSVAAAARYADTQAKEAIKPATSTPPGRPLHYKGMINVDKC